MTQDIGFDAQSNGLAHASSLNIEKRNRLNSTSTSFPGQSLLFKHKQGGGLLSD